MSQIRILTETDPVIFYNLVQNLTTQQKSNVRTSIAAMPASGIHGNVIPRMNYGALESTLLTANLENVYLNGRTVFQNINNSVYFGSTDYDSRLVGNNLSMYGAATFSLQVASATIFTASDSLVELKRPSSNVQKLSLGINVTKLAHSASKLLDLNNTYGNVILKYSDTQFLSFGSNNTLAFSATDLIQLGSDQGGGHHLYIQSYNGVGYRGVVEIGTQSGETYIGNGTNANLMLNTDFSTAAYSVYVKNSGGYLSQLV